MNILRRYTPLATIALLAAAGCSDFLTGGDLSNDPNRPKQVTPRQLLVGAQSNLWSELSSDPARIGAMWTQQMTGAQQQYNVIYNYGVSEATTNGFHQALYLGGGLVDLRKLQAGAAEAHDSVTLGIGQVIEAALVGTGADLFGDIVYSKALNPSDRAPAPDKQLDVYRQVQTLLDQAILNLAATGPSNVGPAEADIVYLGDAGKWTKLAHTLKARFFLHTGEVAGLSAYQSALTEAEQGITDPADDYRSVFSGKAGEQNFWYLFDIVNRPGYLAPNPGFVSLLQSRNDPRLDAYFTFDPESNEFIDLSDAILDPGYDQPLITANENLLIWAEAAQRTGDDATALKQLNAEQTLAGAPLTSGSGNALLREILTEKYIALFQTIEPFNDYKRTCWPNIVPVTSPPRTIPGRLFYDTAERQTDPSLPPPSAQPPRNENDPANAHPDPAPDQVCFGQTGTAPATP
ncbi:MAG: SusD/RagB family nutrient-binding outer membrane lipoprotein [Gemmatimonadaceae bacterium]